MSKINISQMPSHVHTGRELELMLMGRKPLAVFSDSVACLPDEEINPEKQFAPYVDSEKIIRSEFELKSSYKTLDGKYHRVKTVLFAVKGEEWRLDAMRFLKGEHNRTGSWNETCERMEGKLLGYTDEENDVWWQWKREDMTKYT